MIFIPGNVPSSKNSKQWTGRALIDSKTTRRYRAGAGILYKINKNKFLKLIQDVPTPYHITFQFVRDSRRRFDYHNAVQIVADMMTEYGWIEDDNADVFVPVFLPYVHDKKNAGVYIDIL